MEALQVLVKTSRLRGESGCALFGRYLLAEGTTGATNTASKINVSVCIRIPYVFPSFFLFFFWFKFECCHDVHCVREVSSMICRGNNSELNETMYSITLGLGIIEITSTVLLLILATSKILYNDIYTRLGSR